MLKKAGHILIMFLLLFGTTGLTITRHYCSRNLIHTSIYSASHNCCKGNCRSCHNEKINLRISDQFESSQSQVEFTSSFKTLLKQQSLPTLLAFSSTSDLSLLTDDLRDHGIKPSPTKPIYAGHSNAVLQVFLF
jgi:hypothetical protein